ncbi:MAG: histidine phosphatase family protein [Elusimicrobiales bacterium]|nr:histidine phosphatase family protein [Elusimicrobiales bacterium]
MKQIVFLRHGQAGMAAEDSARTLTPLGKEQAIESALRLKQGGFRPDIIISSPYKRAMETAEIAKNVILNNISEPQKNNGSGNVIQNNISEENVILNNIPEIQEEYSIAMQDADAVIAAINAAMQEHDSILIVGHVPLFEELPYYICGTVARMKTGSFAWLEIEGLLPGQRKNNRLKENFIPGVGKV